MITLILIVSFVAAVENARRHGYIIVDGEPMECPLEEERFLEQDTDYCDLKCKERGAKSGVCCYGGCFCYDIPDDEKVVDVTPFRNRLCKYLTKFWDK
ncbi:toxin Isom2-like [Centruroides sculpturatus]|uniref:toxin Isom2-like n=1 Tax=Centruroides sculpturatus TaxID=218467 RepID=UPI000C6D1187|nr:toxin Isom2-like [Centruroides sculpturatus]